MRVWAEAMSLGLCFRKVELSLGVEKCRLLGAQVKFHPSNRAQIRKAAENKYKDRRPKAVAMNATASHWKLEKRNGKLRLIF